VDSFIVVLLGKEGSHLSEPGRKTVYQPPENRPCAIVVETIEFEGNPVMAKCPILAPLVALFLVACTAGETRWVWVHPRYDEARLQTDRDQCRKEAALEVANPFAFPGLGDEYFEEKENLLRRCLEKKGWRLEDERAAPGSR
jgi:hypothetical protein